MAVTFDVLHVLRSRRGVHIRYIRCAPCAPEQERRMRPLHPMCFTCSGAGETHTAVTPDVLHVLRSRRGAHIRYIPDVLHMLRLRSGASDRYARDVLHVLRPRRGAHNPCAVTRPMWPMCSGPGGAHLATDVDHVAKSTSATRRARL